MKLNGWLRVGIIVSLLWVPCAYIYTFDTMYSSDSKLAVLVLTNCEDNVAQGIKSQDACDKDYYSACDVYFREDRKVAILAALVPVPCAWMLTYLVIYLFGWVRRGFKQPTPVTVSAPAPVAMPQVSQVSQERTKKDEIAIATTTADTRGTYKWAVVYGWFFIIAAAYMLLAGVSVLFGGNNLIPLPNAGLSAGEIRWASAICEGLLWLATGLAIVQRRLIAIRLVWILVILEGLGVLVRGIVPLQLLMWLVSMALAIWFSSKKGFLSTDRALDPKLGSPRVKEWGSGGNMDSTTLTYRQIVFTWRTYWYSVVAVVLLTRGDFITKIGRGDWAGGILGDLVLCPIIGAPFVAAVRYIFRKRLIA